MKYTFKKPYAIGLLTLSSSFLNANGNMPNSMDSEEFNWATPQWVSLKKPTFGNIDINVANLNMPQQEEATAEPTIIAARKSARGRAIVYEFNNGTTMTRENGTRAWHMVRLHAKTVQSAQTANSRYSQQKKPACRRYANCCVRINILI